jgi:hypothetical protein
MDRRPTEWNRRHESSTPSACLNLESPERSVSLVKLARDIETRLHSFTHFYCFDE